MDYEFTIEQGPNQSTIVTKELEHHTVIEIIPPPDHFQIRQGPGSQYITTPGARNLPTDHVEAALCRFHRQDWGNTSYPEDDKSNREAQQRGRGIILAQYQSDATTFWIYQRLPNLPNVMLPEEY